MPQNYTAHLTHLVYFGLITITLQVNSFFHARFPVNMVATSDTFIKTQAQ